MGGADAPSELRNWISAAEAAKLLHIRAERLVDAIAKQHLLGKQYLSGFGHSHTMIHRETVTEVAQNRQRFIDKLRQGTFSEYLKNSMICLRVLGSSRDLYLKICPRLLMVNMTLLNSNGSSMTSPPIPLRWKGKPLRCKN